MTAVQRIGRITLAVAMLFGAGRPLAQQPTKVLFMCPHGAAKSVLASAYFAKAARERGLNVRVESAGTEPDAAVSPLVAKHLAAKGYAVPAAKPRAVTPQDLQSADLVVSLGCDVSGLAVKPGTLRQWDEVPGPSRDLKGADAAIERRVQALVEELLAHRK
jgi:protein-tyrosine-phosphatase